MRKLFLFTLLVLSSFVIFAETITDLPEWIYSDVSTIEKYCVVAYAKMSNKQNSIKRAQAEAKNLFAEHIKVKVNEYTKINSVDSIVGSNESLLMDSFMTLSRQYVSASFKGAKQEALWFDPDGGVWVLMSIPTEEIKKSFNKAVDETWLKEIEEESNILMHEFVNNFITKYFIKDVKEEEHAN